MIDLHGASDLERSDPVQAGADGATALRTVGSAAEDARFDAALEIGRIIGRQLRKDAVARVFRRTHESLADAFMKQELAILLGQSGQLTG